MAPGKSRKGKGKGRRKGSTTADSASASCDADGSCEDDGVEVLLEEARSAVDPFAAVKLYQKVLQGRPDDTVTMDEAAELMLQLGETEPAKEILARSISLGPEEGGADKYLYMAQLHEGREALDFYTKGLVLLKKQLENGFDATKREAAALMQRLCMAYCSVGELFLTDLCFEEDAEQRCQDALDQSIAFDYGGPEPHHALANLRLSQRKPSEAVQSAEEAFRRLRLCEPPPEHEFRVSLAKILMECSAVDEGCSNKALEVLSGLMQEDDENVEVWYLMGVAFNGLQPPDYESARDHLKRAAEMLAKIRRVQKEAGGEFAFEDQVQLVEDQLKVAAHAAEHDMEAQQGNLKEVKALGTADLIGDRATEMDCG